MQNVIYPKTFSCEILLYRVHTICLSYVDVNELFYVGDYLFHLCSCVEAKEERAESFISGFKAVDLLADLFVECHFFDKRFDGVTQFYSYQFAGQGCVENDICPETIEGCFGYRDRFSNGCFDAR